MLFSKKRQLIKALHKKSKEESVKQNKKDRLDAFRSLYEDIVGTTLGKNVEGTITNMTGEIIAEYKIENQRLTYVFIGDFPDRADFRRLQRVVTCKFEPEKLAKSKLKFIDLFRIKIDIMER